jgi:2-polyprenyl-3-methyl-5-hydroxy-6-metoxy-1,4-benzoquinol methylase
MVSYSDKTIIDSWLQNAEPWISAVRNNQIESRSLITNKTILDIISEKKPQKVLDIGCGEGWLSRALHKAGMYTYGIEVVPELVDEANKLGGGIFQVLAYEDLLQESIEGKFDVVVCNFSLLGRESVTKIFNCVTDLLNKDGYFIVQTIHPVSGCGDANYEDGWRKGSWKGFSDSFTSPPPWYFRTLESWKGLFQNNGLTLG